MGTFAWRPYAMIDIFSFFLSIKEEKMYFCIVKNTPMTIGEAKYWLDAADYDMDTAEAMFARGRWLHVVFI